MKSSSDSSSTTPSKSPKNTHFSTPTSTTSPSSSPRRKTNITIPSTITESDYENLSNEIVAQLSAKGFDAIIFDFDGTLTKYHSARVSPKDFDPAHDWFADKKILRKILEKGREHQISFHIASKQSQEKLESILETHDLKTLFDQIHGHKPDSETKEEFINNVAESDLHTKILYLDDDAEEIGNEKVITIQGLLPLLSPKTVLLKKDFDGEAGLSFEKWQQVSYCLQNENYKIKKTNLTTSESTQKEQQDFSR